ncbi:MAG: phosphate/phosphite/phosphonate ABC transporter substrate-binding protein [Planctomycetota bacterium]|jgi:ABC-type phosphate/phosphonate transport system substrate-binding protein
MIRLIVICFSLCLLSVSCSQKGKSVAKKTAIDFVFSETVFVPGSEIKSHGNQKTLKLTLAVHDIYCKDTACECVHYVASRRYPDLIKFLKKTQNIDLELVYFPEPYEMEKALVKKIYDGVICKPWMAYMHVPEHKLRYKRIADILDPDNNQMLSGMFIVVKDSKIKTLADINGKRLVMGQSDAYEKYNAPLKMLNKAGIKPVSFSKRASCIECIGELFDEKADVAVVSDYVMSASCAVDIAKPEDFRTIAGTEKMPLTSVILDMDKVSESDALRVQKALLSVSGKHIPESMLSKGFVLPVSWIPESVEK